ncbi:MAG: DUF1002 domain-containing protein [Peptococcaceae bacterium]|nr:DUF1002 domain-containing protein [Peptococcaceae bacterium]
MKKKFISALVLMGLLAMPMAAYADAAVGDQIVTIGTNLNQQQRQEVLEYFGAGENAQIIDVDISEERQYLSGKVPDAQIGNSTNSCAMITYTKKGSGVNVTTHNINYVTPDAYKSAILTAGINDADVQITAPIEVSGTGALTGIMKAYEVSTGEQISEDVKQAATQELVTNAELGQEIGDEQANDLINTIKQEIAEQKPNSPEEVQSIVDQVLQQLGITLTDEQYQQLLDMINQLSQLDIDWDALANNVSSIISQASDYLHSDEGQSFLAKLQDIINSFFDWLRSVFGGDSSDTTSDQNSTTGVVDGTSDNSTTQSSESVQTTDDSMNSGTTSAAADQGTAAQDAAAEQQDTSTQQQTTDDSAASTDTASNTENTDVAA